MMARQGNDKTEYQRRIARGLARGLSPSQARGHPKVGEAYARAGVKLPLYDRDLETGLRAVRDGKSLKAAAKSAHVSQERLRNYMVKSGVVEKRKGRWTVGQDDRKRETLMYSRGQPLKITVAGYERNADIGVYMDTVKKFRSEEHTSELQSRPHL